MPDNQPENRHAPEKIRLAGVIFDLDGTLADTMPLIVSSFRQALARHLERPWTDADFTSLFGLTEEGIFRALSPNRWERCFHSYLAAYEEGHRTLVRRLPEIEEAVRLLKQRGARIAVVSGKGPLSMEISLRHLAMTDLFDAVESGSDERPCKPGAIRKVLAGWGTSPDLVAYLGDTAYDVEATREAGAVPLGAAWVTADRAALQAAKPARIFDHAEGFLRWIEEEVEIAGPNACR